MIENQRGLEKPKLPFPGVSTFSVLMRDLLSYTCFSLACCVWSKFPKIGSLTYLWQLQKTWAASENWQGIRLLFRGDFNVSFSCFIVKPGFQEYFLMSHWREILGSGTLHRQFHWEFKSEIHWLAYLRFGRLLGCMEGCCNWSQRSVGLQTACGLCGCCCCCQWSLWQDIDTAVTGKEWRLCANTDCFPLFICTDKLEINICPSQGNMLHITKKKKGKREWECFFFLFFF